MPATTPATASQTDPITTTLAALRHAPLPHAATALLATLGYTSARIPTMPDDSPRTFASVFKTGKPETNSEREFKASAQAVHILFQISDTEIPEMPAQSQAQFQTDEDERPRFAWSREGRERSFIFAAVQLKPRPNNLPYSRGHYARFAREINKRIVAPVVALFHTKDADEISIAFIGRRPSKTQPDRDVLERVSVIRGVSLANPHAAHIRILAELSLSERRRWMDARAKPQNFDGLLDAWLDALDTDALNKKFYQELFNWFTRALDAAQFPPNGGVAPKDHIIRMLTRLIFIWFIKEKTLVHPNLFIEEQVKELLKDYDRDNGDSYYRAVLQNLFFATLNTEIDKRRFSRDNRADHRNPGLYRYKDLMAKPDDMLAMFKDTPFVNGGLFDCLDDFAGAAAGGRRVDCFTNNLSQRKELSVPNRLFFGEHGLIALFHRYKFTVEENTPLEQEVALDPELLGNVFENLLAATTRETQETARKQTGSYYTPRAVVDYMVDESLIAALSEKIAPDDGNKPCLAKRLRTNLRQLLNYGEDDEAAAAAFKSVAERKSIVKAVAELKIIDPAVGSGAFPMGILHKLTLALRRIDPDNDLWAAAQVEIAVDRTRQVYAAENDAQRREHIQRRINADFERHKDSDFGRKLYLIQNAIYGVDIQPIAAQIAKLRFFISLAIEQSRSNDSADNYGIRALPNLETRFVAANALIGLTPGGDFNRLMDDNKGATRQIAALNDLRARHIAAADRQDKLDIISQEKQAQARLAAELDQMRADWETGQLDAIELKIAALNKQQQAIVRKAETAKYENRKAKFESEFADAQKIAAWKPLDQNAPAADWFDAKYMFDVKDGFDVVIGNPPYVQLQKNGGEMRRKYQDAGFATFTRTGDIYQLFYEKGVNLLTPNRGFLAYITSNSWLKAEYGKATRKMFAESHSPLQLIEMGKDVFQNAIVDSAILLARNGKSAETAKAVDLDKLTDDDKTFPPAANLWGELRTSGERAWLALSATERGVMDKMEAVGTPIKDWDLSIYRGVTTGMNEAFIIDGDTKDALIAADPKSAEIIKPVLRGRDIQRYSADWQGLWLITTFPSMGLDIDDYPAIKGHLLSFGKARLEQSGKRLPGGGRSRKKTRNAWFETSDSTAYHQEFAKEKLIWMDLTDTGRFAYDDSGMFCVNTGFIMTGDAVKYLCGVLNSSLVTWYMSNTSLNSGMGVTRWIPVQVERIPIPRASAAQQAPLATLVNAIISAKASGAPTAALEAQADALVNALYGLTPSESAAASRAAI